MIGLRIIFFILFLGGGMLLTRSLHQGPLVSLAGLATGIVLALVALGLERLLLVIPRKKVFLGLVGLLLGIVLARALTTLVISGLYVFDIEKNTLLVGSNVVKLSLGMIVIYLTMMFIVTRVPEIGNLIDSLRQSRQADGVPKILDSSVVIDGRISDILRTGFIEGLIIIPRFILEEIQGIADSSDGIKRHRGRRGLEILNNLQKEMEDRVQIVDDDYSDIREIDSKLVKLAQDKGAKLLTNDYNLNKIAVLQKVKVLNINELANAMKPVAVSGEDMRIQIVKEGKDAGQGIGYLADGTMVVVENGKRFIGREARVTVTSLHQTAAGRMIFTKLRD